MKRKAILVILLLIPAIAGTTITLYAQKSSDTATTKIGNPKDVASGLWPTTGTITQGPRGTTSHARIQSLGGGPAIDIANAPGTPIYATFTGTIRAYDCTNKGECDSTYGSLGNYAKLIPDSNPGAVILYGHMASITISDGARIKPGDEIGKMGDTGAGPGAFHLHYELRGIPFSPPNIPNPIIPESCDVAPCTPSGVSYLAPQAKATTPILLGRTNQ